MATNTPKLTWEQADWLRRMENALEQLHDHWYGFCGGRWVGRNMDMEVFREVDRKIRLAAFKLEISVPSAGQLAEENEGWDGERNADLMVLWHVIHEIDKKFGAQR